MNTTVSTPCARAALFDRHGATEAAATLRTAGDELEEALRAGASEVLTLSEVAEESGYSERRLRELIASGDIPQAGRRGAPRVRRADLPRRVRTTSAGGYDPVADATEIIEQRKRTDRKNGAHDVTM